MNPVKNKADCISPECNPLYFYGNTIIVVRPQMSPVHAR
mgnify:CR=1 FL=1